MKAFFDSGLLGLKCKGIVLAIVGTGAMPIVASAESLPRWELGLGAGVLSLPEYRGSDTQRQVASLVPYVVYRGDWLALDRQSMRATFWKNDDYVIEASFGGAPPVRARDSGTRAGMPGLRPALEVGPSLKVNLWQDKPQEQSLQLALPIRFVARFQGGLRGTGAVFNPRLTWRSGAMAEAPWNLGVSLASLFGTKKHHAYYYDVASDYVTDSRPEYHARGGYAGAQLTFSANRRVGDWWLGGFMRYDDLHGVAFAGSPVVKRKSNVVAGFAFSRVLCKSSEMVDGED